MRDVKFCVTTTHTHAPGFTLRGKSPEPLCDNGTEIYQIVRLVDCINGIIFATSVIILTWVKTASVLKMLASAGHGVRRARNNVVYILLRDGETHNAVRQYRLTSILTKESRYSVFCVGIGSVILRHTTKFDY